MARNYVGQSATISVAAEGSDPPTATLATPTGYVDVSAFVTYAGDVAAGEKGGAREAHWQLVLPPFAEAGEYVIEIAGEEHTIEVVQLSPEAAARKHAARMDAIARKAAALKNGDE